MKKWLENFWYHHKWATIIVVFFLTVAIILTVQTFSRKKYDAAFMLIGNGGGIDRTQYNDILSSLSSFCEDTDANGEKNILFSRETFISDPNDSAAGVLNSNVTSFMRSVLYQNYYIFFIDPVLYEHYKGSGMFVSLESVVGDVPDEMKYDEFAIKYDACKIKELPGMSAIPEDSLIVIKVVPYYASKSKTEAETASQQAHAEIIKNIVGYGVAEIAAE